MTLRAAFLAVTLTVASSCVSAQDMAAKRSVEVDGLTRTWLQVVPPACATPTANCAIVFGFHGGGLPGVSGAQFDRQTGLGQAAMTRGFIAIMPDGRAMNWNDGRPEVGEKADDVAFVKAILNAARAEKLGYDPARVFATGMSNGGHMSFRLACEMADTFAAIAPVVASLGKALSQQCRPTRAVSILNIVGSADPLTPFAGGQIGLGNRVSRGEGLSSDVSTAFWVRANGCKSPPARSRIDNVLDDATAVEIDRYAGCARGTVIERRVIVDGGHLWPGEVPKGLVARISGRPTREFAGTDIILDFFGIKKVASP